MLASRLFSSAEAQPGTCEVSVFCPFFHFSVVDCEGAKKSEVAAPLKLGLLGFVDCGPLSNGAPRSFCGGLWRSGCPSLQNRS